MATALVAASASGTAFASEDVVAYTTSGDRVALGTVVAAGAASSDGCTFAEPVGFSIMTPGSVVGTTTTDDCRVVVTELGIDPGGVARGTPRGVFLPAVDTTVVGAQRDSYGAAAVPSPAAPAPVKPRIGKIWQEVFDGDGNWQATAYFTMNFDRNQRNGDLQHAYVSYGQCESNTHPLLAVGTDVVSTVEPVSCEARLSRNGIDRVDLRGRGDFRQRVLLLEQVHFRLDEWFVALRGKGTNYVPNCEWSVVSGSWPRGWRTRCGHAETAGVE